MNDFNSYGDEAVAGVQPLFFRVADRMRLEGYVAALIDDNMSLSVVSSHDAILDHYGKLLVARLREAAPQMGLEVYFPASAEALITRFNEVLQAYSIEDAMGTKVAVAPPKIWIVHDASALPDHEIQLLARLVQHFPAANIRVVMLLTTTSKKQRLLASFGRRILNWEVEPPSEEQAQALLEQARAQGREGAVSALLKKITPWHAATTAPAAAPPRPEPVAAASAPPAAPAPNAPAAPAAPPQAAAKKEKTKGSLRKTLLWLSGITALLVACVLAVLMLYGSQQTAALLGIGPRKAPEPLPAASTASPATAPQQDASAAVPAPASGAASALVPAAAPNALGTGTPAGVAPAKAPEAVAAPRSSSAAPPTEVEEIISTPAQAQVGQSWVKQMPPGTFLVQHTIVPSYSEATLWMQAHANLRRARIVATYLNGQASVQFAVVSGPFASLAEANTFAASSGVPKDPQIRSARSMKDHFAP